MKRPYASPFSRSVGALGSLTVLASAASVGCQQPAGRFVPVVVSARCGRADEGAVRRLLERRIPEVNLDGESFGEVVEYLRALLDTNIQVNWTALEYVSIRRTVAVHCQLREVPASTVLNTILDEVGAGETELDYELVDNVLQISTKEDLSRRTCLHVYDVRDLLAGGYAGRVYDPPPELIGVFTAYGSASPHRSTKVLPVDEYRGPDALAILFQTSIEPESWRVTGGNVGSICAYGNVLVVVQTHSAHRQIGELLATLRRALRPGTAIEYTPIPPRPATTRPTGTR